MAATDLVTVETFANPLDAHLVELRFASAGIPAAVLDDHITTLQPLWVPMIGGARVAVAARDVDRAKRILDRIAESRGAVGRCPECRSADCRLGIRWGVLAVLFLGFPIGPFRARSECRACGHRWWR